jgi:hypothetical protein
MIDKVSEEVAKEVISPWSARRLAPALAFWAGATLAYQLRQGIPANIADLLPFGADNNLPYLVVGAILVVVTSFLVSSLEQPALRLLEGYWPRWCPLRRWGVRRTRAWLDRRYGELRALNERMENCQGDAECQAKLDALHVILARYPVQTERALPMNLGNLLRAAEEYPQLRYGLEITVTWPRLWLLLPDSVKGELEQARERLNERVGLLLWSALYALLGLGPLGWQLLVALGASLYWPGLRWIVYFPAPVGLLFALIAAQGIWDAAAIYGDQLRAAYDLHRFALYQALRLPPPALTSNEPGFGEKLSDFLFFGASGASFAFRDPDNPASQRGAHWR